MSIANSESVREQLDRILASNQFRAAPRQSAFLRFVVDESLTGRSADLKETLIAIQVYGKPADYDPRVDSTVRVEAAKLRQRLAAYYEGAGAGDRLRLSIPKGGYQVRIEEPGSDSEPAQAARYQFPLRAAAAATVALAAVWILWPRPGSHRSPVLREIHRLTALGAYATDPAISPEGDFAVYSSDRDSSGVLNLWRHPLDGGAPVRLARSGVNHREAAISPDGRHVVFRSDNEGGQLYVMPAAGGEPRRVGETGGARNPRIGGPEGRGLVYWVPRDQETPDYGRVFLTSTQPGSLSPVPLFGDFAHAAWPIWSGDGRHVLALGTWHSDVPEKEFDAWVVELEGRYPKGPPVKTGLFPLLKAKGIYRNTWERTLVEVSDWRDGWLYLTAPSRESRDLFRVELPEPGGRVQGDPQRLTSGASAIRGISIGAAGKSLAFVPMESSDNLYSLELPDRSGEPAGEPYRHTIETGINFRAAVAPSGKAAVWERRATEAVGEVWSLDLAAGLRRNLTAAKPAARTHPILSSNGDTVAYRVLEPGSEPIYVQPAAGGPEKRICANCGTPSDWTADGRYIFYITGGNPAIIGMLDTTTGAHGDLIRHPTFQLHGVRARVNNLGDGWVAFYAVNSPRTRQILLARLTRWKPAAAKDWIPVTDGTQWDQSPAWSPDGRTLFFTNRHDGFRCIMARTMDPITGQPAGPAWALRHFHASSQTLMLSAPQRGADALWAAGNRLYFMLDDRRSSVWLASLD